MSTLALGSYVTHAKLPELGTGEVLACEKGVTRIRFASGERNFRTEIVEAHLAISDTAPPVPEPARKRARRAAPKA